MSLFAKIMVVVNFLLAVAFLAAAGTLLGAAEDWKKKYEETDQHAKTEIANKTAQIENDKTTIQQKDAKAADLQQKLSASDAQLKQLDDSNKAVEAANADLRAALSKLSDAQKDLQSQNAEKDKAITTTRNDLATSEAARKDAEAKLKATQDALAQEQQNRETAEKGLKEAETAQTALAAKNDELATTVERYRQEKGPLTGAIAMEPVHGVVQAVSNKDDIYVISVGSKDKVKVGYEFTVYRDSEYVSTIVIDKVFPNYASGRTKPGTKRRDVQAGDECTTQL